MLRPLSAQSRHLGSDLRPPFPVLSALPEICHPERSEDLLFSCSCRARPGVYPDPVGKAGRSKNNLGNANLPIGAGLRCWRISGGPHFAPYAKSAGLFGSAAGDPGATAWRAGHPLLRFSSFPDLTSIVVSCRSATRTPPESCATWAAPLVAAGRLPTALLSKTMARRS